MPPLLDWFASFALASVASVVLAYAALALVVTAARSCPLGATTLAFGALATIVAAIREARAPLAIARGVASPVIVFTAGLFVLVEALDNAGAAALPRTVFAWGAHVTMPLAKIGIAGAAALASNIVNNLPVGLDTSASSSDARTRRRR
jgi:arsenical pump membrane protein